MRLSDLLSTALRNLYERKARTLLTILGVIIGTMSITLMIAVGLGSQQAFIESISQSEDLTRIQVSKNWSSDPKKKGKLDEEAIKFFEGQDNVKLVLPMKNVAILLESSKYIGELYAQAVPMEKLEQLSPSMEWGSIKSGSSGSMRVYIGADMATTAFYKKKSNKELWEMPQAREIDLKNIKFESRYGGYSLYKDPAALPQGVTVPKAQKCTVEGVFTRTGSELDYGCYIDVAFVNKLLKENKQFASQIGIESEYQNVYVYMKDMNSVEAAMTALKEAGYSCSSPLEWIAQMKKESQRQQIVWGAVGAIALLVSAIGIANTMLTSIMERRREIGILKVLGCPLDGINLMFLTEAAVLGLFGGAIGVALSFLLAYLARFIPALGENVRFVITPWLALLCTFGAAGIGMLAGIYPSYRATRMSALSALRDE